jgi:RNA polymerase sigma-70 factor (ECF subfamily)
MNSSFALIPVTERAPFNVVTSSPLPANCDGLLDEVGEVDGASADGPDITAAIGPFVQANHATLLSRALWLTRDQADARDLLQDTFERALTASRRTIPTARLKSWILVIMHNLFLDRRRAAARRSSCSLTDQIIDHVSSKRGEAEEPALWEAFDAAAVEAALPRLPVTLQRTFQLYAQGMQYAEIAQELRIPAGTVATRIHRARHLLRDLLQADC